VHVANFSGHRAGSPIAAGDLAVLLRDVADAVTTAQTLSCPTLMLLTNALNPDGSVADTFDEIPDNEKFHNTVVALQKILAVTPGDIALVLEPLNTRIDHPGYYLADMATASALVRETNAPHLKVLCDLYHLGVMGNDLGRLITDYLPDIGYFHVADVPGRHEPGTGSVDWLSLLRLIQQGGYTGYVGFEYSPARDSDTSLHAIRRLWDAL
jgi:hydroxypyruvate isomerase